MANFILAREIVLENEGGYQDNPVDSGNYTTSGELIGTNHGISAKVLEAWLGYEPSVSDMKNLSVGTASQIYKKKYWDAYRLDELISQDLAEIVFDGIVNHGAGGKVTKGGVNLLQRSLVDIGYDVTIDGKLGSATLAATNTASLQNEAQIYNEYRKKRIAYYYEIVAKNPVKEEFLDGWLSRMDEFPKKTETINENSTSSTSVPMSTKATHVFKGLFKVGKSEEATKEWLWIMAIVACVGLSWFFLRKVQFQI